MFDKFLLDPIVLFRVIKKYSHDSEFTFWPPSGWIVFKCVFPFRFEEEVSELSVRLLAFKSSAHLNFGLPFCLAAVKDLFLSGLNTKTPLMDSCSIRICHFGSLRLLWGSQQ